MTFDSGCTLTEFDYGPRVVLVPKAYPDLARPQNLESIARANGLRLLWLKEPAGLFSERWNAERLQSEYAGNQRLRAFYRDILAVQSAYRPSLALFMGDGGYWHPEFLNQLKPASFVALWTGDDPEGSEITSRPFVRNFAYAFCGGIWFSETVRIEEKFREWGAPMARFIPLGACKDKYRMQGERPEAEFFSTQRDIDVIYVGAAYRGKLWRVLTLKRHFKDRLFLAGRRWNGAGLGWKGVAVRLFTYFGGLGEIREVAESELIGLYQRSRIGFNCHLSYGPSNLRMYELPLNGVMQVCDCRKGLAELYDVGREVIAYDTVREAIDQIEFHLSHEAERVAIARAGYARALRDYPMERSVARLLGAVDEHLASR
jgi:spore maturation protein CgeB